MGGLSPPDIDVNWLNAAGRNSAEGHEFELAMPGGILPM